MRRWQLRTERPAFLHSALWQFWSSRRRGGWQVVESELAQQLPFMTPAIVEEHNRTAPDDGNGGIDHIVCGSVTGTQEHIRLRSP